MVDYRVKNFVQKFCDLWRGGHSARVDIECHEGEAWIDLRLNLGHHRVDGAQHRQDRDGGHRRGASYMRRMERRAAMRAAGQVAGNAVRGAPTWAEQVAGVDRGVPAQAVGAGEEVVRVGGVDDTTGEVVDARKDNSEEVGDNTSAVEVLGDDDRDDEVSGTDLDATEEQEEEEEMTNEEWIAYCKRLKKAGEFMVGVPGGGHGQKPTGQKPTRQWEDGHKSERVQGKTGRAPAPLLRRGGRREAARPRNRGGGEARDLQVV